MSLPLLKAEQLSCQRDDLPLFAPVNFALYPGQVLQLAGPNGSGKTSLLRVLAGLSERYEGSLLWRGEPPSGSQRLALAAELCYLGHNNGIKSALTPLENLHWYAAMHGVRNNAALHAALAQVGLAGHEETPCYQLSAGQRQRVALARLFVLPVGLWLLDEPFTAIDKQGVAQLEQWLAEFAAGGGAVVLTTHHPLAMANLQQLPLEPCR